MELWQNTKKHYSAIEQSLKTKGELTGLFSMIYLEKRQNANASYILVTNNTSVICSMDGIIFSLFSKIC